MGTRTTPPPRLAVSTVRLSCARTGMAQPGLARRSLRFFMESTESDDRRLVAVRNHTAVASCVTVSHVFTPHGGAHKSTSGRRLLRQTVRQTAATVASRTHRREMTALLAQRVPAWRTTPRGKVARCPARNGLTLPTRWKATKRANGACNTLYPGGRETGIREVHFLL